MRGVMTPRKEHQSCMPGSPIGSNRLREARQGRCRASKRITQAVERGFLFALVGASVAACSTLPQAYAQEAKSDLAAPRVEPLHREYLSRIARRTVRDRIVHQTTYEPEYIPQALQDAKAEVVVRLRQSGYPVGAGAGGPIGLAIAVRDGALAAAAQLEEKGMADADTVTRLLIEIEVVGEAEEFTVEGDWTQPRALDAHIEPGMHGLVMLAPKKQSRICPTEFFTNDKTVSDAVADLLPMLAADAKDAAKTTLLRFRTTHWYQPPDGDRLVPLVRGLAERRAESVTAESVREAIDRLAAYMQYRQKSSGLFSYNYAAGADRYSDDDNLVRQVGATAAMATHARWSDNAASRSAAELAIRLHLEGLTEVPGDSSAAFIATADSSNKLGVTALLTIALGEHPDAVRYSETREKLVRGMLWRQRPSGMFLTAFPPSGDMGAQDYFPGEALLAMACAYGHAPSTEILDAFHRAIAFYHDYFEGNPSPAFVPWQVQAFARMAEFTKRKDYADFAFKLSDWLSAYQLDETNCTYPDLYGGFAPYSGGRAGIATASYLEGFTDALKLARAVGDVERAKKYEAVVRRAARFVLQLQVQPDEAYFVRSPKDALWGMRTAPALNLLRIDHSQHALVALMKTHDVLYGEKK